MKRMSTRIATAGNRRDFEALTRAMEQHQLRPMIDRTFPVSEFRTAFDHLERGGPFGKIVLTF